MKRILVALGFAATGCAEDLPQLDSMTGKIGVGAEYCNWTPTESSDARIFDLGAGLQVKEAVGVSLTPDAYWLQEPGNAASRTPIEGIFTAVSSDVTLLDVFSAPDASFALLARRPGTATLTFTLAGHPGTFTMPVTVVPADGYIDRKEVAPAADEDDTDGGAP